MPKTWNAKRERWENEFGSETDEPEDDEPEPKFQRRAQLTHAESADAASTSDEERIQHNVCTAWSLPRAGVWFLTARLLKNLPGQLPGEQKARQLREWLKENPVTYGRTVEASSTLPLPPELDARFEADYVRQAEAGTLVRLLDKVQRQEVYNGGVLEHSAPTPNVFDAMLSPHAPARMAYAEEGRLEYTYGKPRGGGAYVTKPASWASTHPAEAELCTLLREMAGELTTKLLSGAQRFNYVLVQRYAGRNVFLSFHRDAALKPPPHPSSKEAGQVYGTPVASISLGAERVFAFTMDRQAHAFPMYGLRLPHRCLITMSQRCNDTYAHALLLGSQDDEDGVRYNLTFRVMQPAAA